MEQGMHIHQARGAFKPALAIFLFSGLFSACVSQEQYDEVEMEAKKLERRYFELDRQRAALEAENLKLKRQLEAGGGAADASFDDIDSRLQSLNETLAELGKNPGDITKFRTPDGYGYSVKDSILFPFASAEVTAEGIEALRTVATDITSRPYETIWVRGHTDDVPVKRPETLKKFPHGNMHLSVERAVETAAILKQQGRVDETKLVVMGFGPNEPLVPNSSPENRQRNRRVEIFVTEPR
jgi:chemotaxis protein MotB